MSTGIKGLTFVSLAVEFKLFKVQDLYIYTLILEGQQNTNSKHCVCSIPFTQADDVSKPYACHEHL